MFLYFTEFKMSGNIKNVMKNALISAYKVITMQILWKFKQIIKRNNYYIKLYLKIKKIMCSK